MDTDTLLNSTQDIGLDGLGVKVIMTRKFTPSESQDFRYGCRQKNFGGIWLFISFTFDLITVNYALTMCLEFNYAKCWNYKTE